MAPTTNVDPEQIRQLALLYLSQAQTQSPQLAAYLDQVGDRVESIGDARAYVTPMIPGGLELPAQLKHLVATYPESAKFFDAFIREGIVTGETSAYVDSSAGLAAGIARSGIAPNVAEPLIRVALTGLFEGPDLGLIVRLLGLRETAERIQSAIRVATTFGEAQKAVNRETLDDLAVRVLGSARAVSHMARRLAESMYRHAPSFRTAFEWWSVFLPDRKWVYDAACTQVLAARDIDVALLCFAQIYLKAAGREVNAFGKSLLAGHEVSQVKKDDVARAVCVAVTGFANWSFDTELTCDLIGGKDVTDRVKHALAGLRARA
ncbi:MAG: hypothetical protein IT350_00520 [Deltaproteobacteria bacterium]|nr:hypothetical protein [Deltaproteobacteria bacterium]